MLYLFTIVKITYLFFIKKKIFWKLFLFILKSLNINRGLRFQKLNFFFKNFDKKILFSKKFSNKKNNYYQHKFSKKKILYPYFNYRVSFLTFIFRCVSFFKSFKKFIAKFKSINGTYIILPLIDCIKFENKVSLYKNAWRFIFFMYVGSLIRLKYYDILFLISNLGFLQPLYAISMGTFIILNNKKKYFIVITLPSGKKINFSNKGYAILGRNSGIFSYKQYFGKASTSLFNKKINVRSVAKNPVDHPNGGRTRGKLCFKTPWGLVAKFNK